MIDYWYIRSEEFHGCGTHEDQPIDTQISSQCPLSELLVDIGDARAEIPTDASCPSLGGNKGTKGAMWCITCNKSNPQSNLRVKIPGKDSKILGNAWIIMSKTCKRHLTKQPIILVCITQLVSYFEFPSGAIIIPWMGTSAYNMHPDLSGWEDKHQTDMGTFPW